MTQQIIDTGLVANDGTGESLRNAFSAVNNNFANVWAAGPVDTQVIIYSNVVSTNVTNLDLRLAGNGIGTITVESTVVPSIDRVYDLGTPTKQYDSVYAQYYFGNGAFLTGISGGNGSASNSFSTISANGVNIVATSATDTLTLASGNNVVILGNSGTDTVSISLVNNPVFSGNVTAGGNIIGSNVNTVNLSLSGNVISGLTVSGNVTAPYFQGNGSQLTGVVTSLGGNLAANINTGIYNLFSSNGAVKIDDTLSVTGTVITTGGILSGGPFTTTANVTANYFIGDGSQLTNLPSGNYSNANVAAYLPTYTGNVAAGNVSTTGNIQGSYLLGNGSQLTGVSASLSGNLSGNINTGIYNLFSSNGAVKVDDALSVTGTVTATGGLITPGAIATTANVTANYFVGDGSQLTNLPAGNYSNANVAAYLPTYTGNVAAGNVSTTGNIQGSYLLGNGSQLTGISASLSGNLTGNINTGIYNLFSSNGAVIVNDGLSVTGTVTTTGGLVTPGAIATTANVTANYFVGDGSQLTNLPAGNYSNANVAAYLPTYTGNVLANNFIGNGAALTSITAANILGTVANATYALNANSATFATTAGQANYAIVANSVAGANVSGTVANATYALNSNTSNYTNQANIATVANSVAGANVSGTVADATYALNANAATFATTAVNSGQANYANIANSVTGANVVGIVANAVYAVTASSANTANTAGLAQFITANTQANITSVGVLTSLSSTGNITAPYFVGNGSQLTGVVTSLVGNLAGNIDTLEYSINSSNGEVRFGNSISVIGNAIVTNDLIVGDQIATTGNITTAANVYAQNFIGNVYGNVFANILIPGGNTDVLFNTNGEADATSGLRFNKVSNVLTVGGNVSAVGNVSGNYILGNGSQLTGLPELYGNANVAAYLPTYTGNLTAGNASVVGNVTANAFFGNTASIVGNITTSANVIAQYFVGNFAGNISGNLTVPGLSTQVIFNTDGAADATSGFTFNKTTNAVSIGGNASAVGNITASYFIGNGSQLTGIDATLIQNGNSNVKVYANANVATSVNGVANVLVMANTGAFVTGIISATGNAIFANISTSGLITATGNVTGGNISTTGITSTNNFVITGEITGNLIPTANVTYDLGDPDNRWNDLYLSGNSIYIDSQIISANAAGLTLSNTAFMTSLQVSANASVGNLGTAGIITATGNITAGNINTAGVSTVTGNIIGGNINTAGQVSATGNVDSGNINTAGLISATGNATVGNINTAGIVTATGNITGNNLNAVGLSLSGNVQSAINTTSNITTTANIATGGILTDNYYYANGTPLDFEQPAGANTQIQFNDNDNFGATAAFTFDTAANALYVGGTTSVTGNVNAGNLITTGLVAADAVTSYTANANLSLSPNGTGIVTITDTDGGSTGIELGTPTSGALVSNAVTLTTSTSVTNGIAQLNLILGKLVPPSPPNFPGGNTLSITTATSSGRMTSGFTQTDNTPGANKAVTAGNVVSVVRGSSYGTNTISNTGPGDSGILTAYLNGNPAGNVTFNTGASPSANGTYGGNLIVSNNYDYNTANASIAAGFWYVFTARASGTVTEGWNEIYLGDSATGNTNTPSWYYDASTPGTPTYSNVTVTACATPSLSYSSTIPHYNSGTQFDFGFSVNKLSGDLYPNNGNLLTNSTAAGGAFQTPASVTYAAANVTVPLSRNLYVSSGAATGNTTANIVASGFGSSTTGPSVTVTNSYNSASQAFTTALANTVLYKNGTSTAIDEANVVIGSTIGTGSGNAFRIDNPGSGNTPAYTSNAAAFNSQSSTLETYDSTVVGSGSAGVLKHDQTNYSTGYLPAGPDLSAGRTGTQYFTFKFVRTAVSKFDIRYTGTIAGMWVALPGSVIDSSSGANGWIDMSVAYGGAGYPGVTAPGNGSDGCALAGTVTLNSAVTNSSKTCTFGTVSSSSTATNEIYVRIALTSGQSVTALTLQTASN